MQLRGSCHCQAITFEVTSHTPYPLMHCYCSICRKTAGGGGYAINIMGEKKTLRVRGKKHLQIYHAVMDKTKGGRLRRSSGQRHFCKHCGSCLWIYDPAWPEWIYPFASAIDTSLPIPPEHVHILLDYAANWCEIPTSKRDRHFRKFTEESIEDWHKRHGIYER